MLEMLGVCCVTSSEEAEALCAQLNLHGVSNTIEAESCAVLVTL